MNNATAEAYILMEPMFNWLKNILNTVKDRSTKIWQQIRTMG